MCSNSQGYYQSQFDLLSGHGYCQLFAPDVSTRMTLTGQLALRNALIQANFILSYGADDRLIDNSEVPNFIFRSGNMDALKARVNGRRFKVANLPRVPQ